MPIRVVTGPAFAGKSQAVERVRRPGDVLLDTTLMWRAMFNPEPGDERTMDQARIVNQAKRAALERAVELEQDGWLTVAERDPLRLSKWLAAAGAQKALMVTAPMADLRSRARKSGPSCEALVDKWDGYEDDAELAAITEPWNEDDMRTTIDVETEYRALCEAVSVRDVDNGLVERRCLIEDAELRADIDKREVTGTLVRYGDEARLPGFRERIRKGAFRLPKRASNVTLQHVRALPIGLAGYIDDDDAMRFRVEVAETPRGDQALADIRAGLLRGASVEMRPGKHRTVEAGGDDGPLVEIMEAAMLRFSVVDDGAYPDSRISARAKVLVSKVDKPPDNDMAARLLAYLKLHDDVGRSIRQCRRDITGNAARIDAALRDVGQKGEDGLWRVRRADTAETNRVRARDRSRRLMVV